MSGANPIHGIRRDDAVTVAILTRDAGPLLARVLEAVSAQETPRRVDVLAVDSGSTDDTLDTLRKHDARVVNVPPGEFDWGRTRDLAYREAQTPVIVNLSQDAVPAHNQWLENLIAPLADPAAGASCGPSRPDPERGFRQFPWERNGYFYFTREIRRFVARHGRGLSFANSAVPRAVWEQLGLDPQPIGEDFQFQIKLRAAGLNIAFPEDAPVLHHHNYPLGRLYLRCRNEGLALRHLGCPYSEWDLARDLASLPKYVQWLRELCRGDLRAPADFVYPALRPLAVYVGSRFARRHVWR
ncbi:MAG: glycosyltransferase family 2 protein [Candidatus Hydrogenedentes bacterium]|nr:glycosyltransferase family 2 protein [Candidatus Hydrogenedentota bacterium]